MTREALQERSGTVHLGGCLFYVWTPGLNKRVHEAQNYSALLTNSSELLVGFFGFYANTVLTAIPQPSHIPPGQVSIASCNRTVLS